MSATLAPGSAPAELAAFLEDMRVLVDRDLERRLAPPADDPGRLVAAMHYAATGPGKRLRPAIVLAAAEACGGTREQALPAASALEMLHAYTLVHDDLPAMDDDDERRGRPTVHIAFGEAVAILAGDGLLTEAFGALAELGAHAEDAVRVLAQRAGRAELLLGQAIDLSTAAGQRLATVA
ncbi:MAG: polyprenyl synthetase family protein, partial [Kofleriaceae bacterium]